MDLFRKRVRIATREIKFLEGLTPLKDEVFIDLLQQALRGAIPVYFGAVPLGLIRPYDEIYNPESHPVGKAAIQQVVEAWQPGQFQTVWVYPEGDHFVLSDDYIPFAAALKGKPDYVPCWILGAPDVQNVKDLQGPVDPKEIKHLLGFE